MFEENAIQALAILIALILLGMGLRNWGVLKEEHGQVFSRVIVNVTIPALIFSSLSCADFDSKKLLLAMVMIFSQLGCALLAWVISGALKLSRPRRGALILASTFTSSAFLGYAVVKEIFGNDLDALADAAVVSELGVATLLFTFGIFVAMHFGMQDTPLRIRVRQMTSFFYSPIFITLILSIAISFVRLPKENLLIAGFYDAIHIITDANTFLVSLTIGVMLHFKDLRRVWMIVLLAVVIKLVIQPLLSWGQAELLAFPLLWKEIVVLEAAMPTATMTAVLAKRYGCDAELTSILVFATFISSILTMVTMVMLLT
ncbi:MAG: AEC family transporter [Bacteroidales bacterium]|nr:AEC family transporter [Bacteroidales bacterium]